VKVFASVGLLLLVGASSICAAQELRCTQVFMNASEKRICATPALMDLDEQIGELGRRAAMHQDSYKSDQRTFRKALKTCDGEETCLATSYQNRIRELQAYVASLPPPTEGEAAKLAKAGARAQEKRDAQAETRGEIAEHLAESETAEQAEALPVAEDAPAEVSMVQPVEVASVAQEPAAAEAEGGTAAPATDKSSGEAGWGGIALLFALITGALVWFKSWLNRAVRRCPRCKKWFAGKVIDSEQDAYTDYQTKTFEDVHKDRNYNVTGRTTKQRQVKIRVGETTNYFQCLHCDCKWALTSTSRSS
jgi:uncharacterized protein